MALHQLKANKGARKKRTIWGRGIGSGLGKTSGRGILGQGARSGGSVRPGFEGGQNPLYRRIPKRGFKNYTTLRYGVVNVGDLNQFKDGSEVNPTILIENGLIKTNTQAIKILGNGKLAKKLKVFAHHFSQSALKAISEAGGTTEVIK